MVTAPIPSNEAERLKALHACRILETKAERGFDEIVELASQVFDVPIALVSLVDENRQWFKAKVGLDVCETGRDVSFCGHAIVDDGVLVIEDALADERFLDNPFVTEPPHIRFYAGAPVASPDGLPLGTLCLIDDQPRRFSEEQVAMLHNMANQVGDQIKLHVAINETKAYQTRLEERVAERTQQLERSREEVVHCLARAGEHRDDDTGCHVQRVSLYTRVMCEALGLAEPEAKTIALAATLHDVGKIAVPDDLLRKPGKLTDAEFDAMKRHATAGFGIIAGDAGAGDCPPAQDRPPAVIGESGLGLLDVAAEIARTHHEWYDGRGYPAGLKGDDIPLAGRIVAVADVFDALSSVRPYKPAYPIGRCREILEEGRGSHFDPRVLDAFLSRLADVESIRARWSTPAAHAA